MKVKIISTIVLMTMSSFSVVADNSGSRGAANTESRSPFQVDQEKSRSSEERNVLPTPSVPVTRAAQPSSIRPPAHPPVRSAVTGAYNPQLTLSLQESHLLSQDIRDWAASQGMRPLWNSNRDFLIYSTITLTGKSRDDVLNQLGELFRSENYGLVIKLYEKNNVLVIDSQ